MKNLRWWLSALDLDEPLPPGFLFITGVFLSMVAAIVIWGVLFP